jgi:hypothetical protein
MMNTFAKILILSLTSPLLLSAGLTFEEARIVHEATMEESEYTGTFVFKNEGDKAVKILEVSSSCGCTTALPSKRVFESGESGEISATFDYGEREGKQVKSIRVETDLEKDPRIFLTLEVNIPSAMEFSPSVVMWNRASDSDFKAKEVIIESKMEESIEIMEIVTSSDLFTSISIAPQNIPTESGGIIRGTFVVKTSLSNPLKGTFKVYAIVR